MPDHGKNLKVNLYIYTSKGSVCWARNLGDWLSAKFIVSSVLPNNKNVWIYSLMSRIYMLSINTFYNMSLIQSDPGKFSGCEKATNPSIHQLMTRNGMHG
ncbi:hypothetical protein OIU78_018664 [Salix suchowensis]|nr:hypothetical protein OIU78_018664 [Salix suchowensis]